jgi:hypothetical protein
VDEMWRRGRKRKKRKKEGESAWGEEGLIGKWGYTVGAVMFQT